MDKRIKYTYSGRNIRFHDKKIIVKILLILQENQM